MPLVHFVNCFLRIVSMPPVDAVDRLRVDFKLQHPILWPFALMLGDNLVSTSMSLHGNARPSSLPVLPNREADINYCLDPRSSSLHELHLTLPILLRMSGRQTGHITYLRLLTAIGTGSPVVVH